MLPEVNKGMKMTSHQGAFCSLSDIVIMAEHLEVIMGKVVLHDRPPRFKRKLVRLERHNISTVIFNVNCSKDIFTNSQSAQTTA